MINYDLPQNNEDYVHRIGRTARQGLGSAVSFACEICFSLEDIEDYRNEDPVSSVEESLMPDLNLPEKPEHRSLKKGWFLKKSQSVWKTIIIIILIRVSLSDLSFTRKKILNILVPG